MTAISSNERSSTAARAATTGKDGVTIRPVSIFRSVSADSPAAGAVVADVLATTRAAAAARMTPLELDALAVDVIASHRAASCYIGYHPSWAPYAYPTVTCISVNDAVVHAIPDGRPFEPGDLVSIDIACTLDGWAAEAAVSVVIPGSDDTTLAEALIATAGEALVAGIEEMRVGRKLGDVSAAIGGVVRPRGFGMLADHGGHGIGREMHQPPWVANEGRRHRGMPLRSGVVLALSRWWSPAGTATRTTPMAGVSVLRTAHRPRTSSTPSPSPRTDRGCSPCRRDAGWSSC